MRAEGAAIYELDADGIRCVDYDDVTAVLLWRRFREDPDRLLSVLYSDDD